jgi:hypothetical protein
MVRISTPTPRRSRSVSTTSSRLAEAEHQAGLGRDVRRVGARPRQQLQRVRILPPDRAIR